MEQLDGDLASARARARRTCGFLPSPVGSALRCSALSHSRSRSTSRTALGPARTQRHSRRDLRARGRRHREVRRQFDGPQGRPASNQPAPHRHPIHCPPRNCDTNARKRVRLAAGCATPLMDSQRRASVASRLRHPTPGEALRPRRSQPIAQLIKQGRLNYARLSMRITNPRRAGLAGDGNRSATMHGKRGQSTSTARRRRERGRGRRQRPRPVGRRRPWSHSTLLRRPICCGPSRQECRSLRRNAEAQRSKQVTEERRRVRWEKYW
jgi:hypothetical protein